MPLKNPDPQATEADEFGPLAGVGAWIRNALFHRAAPIDDDFRGQVGKRLIIWPDKSETTVDLDPPPTNAKFACHSDFCRYVAEMHTLFLDSDVPGPPQFILVGTAAACIQLDPYKQYSAVLTYQFHPSFELLSKMTSARWMEQKEAYEFARFDLAPLLGDSLANRIGQMAWTAKGQTVTAVGGNRDKGLREFEQAPSGDEWSNDRLEVDVTATVDRAQQPLTTVKLQIAVQTKLDDAGKTHVRIYPTAVSIDLAKKSIASQYAALILNKTPGPAVYITAD